MAVRDMMEEKTVTISSDGTLEEVLGKMIKSGTCMVRVMDDGELLGRGGDTDIGRLVAKGVDLSKAKTMDFIAACMLTGNQPCVQIRDEDSAINALRIMDLSTVTNLVVVDKDDKVVGTLSVLDALRGWKKKV